VVLKPAELHAERSRHAQEQIDVHEPAQHREGELLHDCGGQQAGERRGRDRREEDVEHHDGAEAGREDSVHRGADRVGREHGWEQDVRLRVGRPQHDEPRDRGEAYPNGLDRDCGDQVPGRDGPDAPPQPVEPAADVDAEGREDPQDPGDGQHPGGHLGEAPRP